MAPSIPAAKATLSYPLYAADFDSSNSGYLVVGGGGGEGRSGVGNKLTLLDTSRQTKIDEAAEIDLSRDEDSVTSLATLKTARDKLVALAGINSSSADQSAGKNEHLREFNIRYPPKKDGADTTGTPGTEKGNITFSGKKSLFRVSAAAKKETYQRVIRLSRDQNGAEGQMRVGAVATGLAPEGEIVVFNATKGLPQDTDVFGRISLDKGEEAADVDIIEAEEGEYLLAYATDHEVFISGVGKEDPTSTNLNSKMVYSIPHPDSFSPNVRPTFRALRFITPSLVLLLTNKPKKSGAELWVLQIGEGLGEIVSRKRLHSSMKAAIGLDTATLSSPNDEDKQFVIAAAGQDVSIELLTLNYHPSRGPSKFRCYTTLRDVHPLQMTRLAFSTFHPPNPVTSDTLPQYLKLASVSMGNTVVVHTLPLTPLSPRSKTRYVLQPPSTEALHTTISVTFSLIVIIISAVLLQAFLEIRGGSPSYLGAVDYLPSGLKARLARPYIMDDINHSAAELAAKVIPTQRLRHLLLQRKPSDEGSTKAIVVRETDTTEVSAELMDHAELVEHEAKRWEELQPEEQEKWRQKLIAAGEWVYDEGDTILKGIFFGELGGMIGQAVMGG